MNAAHPAIDDPWEFMLYWDHVRAAEAGRPASTVADISAYLGCGEGGTMVALESRMQKRGWIKVDTYQRERRITIMATGQQTAAPKTPAPHWRKREEHQLDPMPLMRARYPDAYKQIILNARRERRSVASYCARLMAEAMREKHL